MQCSHMHTHVTRQCRHALAIEFDRTRGIIRDDVGSKDRLSRSRRVALRRLQSISQSQ